MGTARGSYVQEERFADFDFDIEVKIREPIITVQLYEMNTGIRSRGSAKRNDPDKFDVNAGRMLALSRAMARFARRLERFTLREINTHET